MKPTIIALQIQKLIIQSLVIITLLRQLLL